MALPGVYIATSVPSYLTARPSRNVLTLAQQELTREWWEGVRERYRLFVSEVVLAEIREGDPDMARARVAAIQSIPFLAVTDEMREMGAILMREIPSPAIAATDALHIAVAIAHEIEYIATWYCRHLAHAGIRSRLEAICHARTWTCPTICTPAQL